MLQEGSERLGSVGYNPNITHLQVGYNPFTNHGLTSWDIQVCSSVCVCVWVMFFDIMTKKMTQNDDLQHNSCLDFFCQQIPPRIH